jgi:hypothetical protein
LRASAGGREIVGMGVSNKSLWLAVAATIVVPSKARARAHLTKSAVQSKPVQRQARRREARAPQTLSRVTSPCGRHYVDVVAGVVFVDGHRVHPSSGAVYLLAAPSWRRDGRAVAWVEREEGAARPQLVIIPAVDGRPEPMPWSLPSISPDDQIFWAGPQRVVVGPALLVPRAVASWTESS